MPIVPLAPKAHDLIVALVRKAGHLVTKHELARPVWPDAAVEEGILAVHVSACARRSAIRAAIIETVAGSGYRFIGDVVRDQPSRPSGSRCGGRSASCPPNPEVHELIGSGRAYLLTASWPGNAEGGGRVPVGDRAGPGLRRRARGLALACCAQAELRLAPTAEAYAEARAAALRALAMEDASADAHVALATVLFLSDWNWTGAERSLERALAIDPHHADACLLYGRLLEALGRLDDGLAAKQKALERNPHSALVHMQIALSYWHQRRYDDVIAWSNRALALDPKHLLAREFIASAYWKLGDFDRQMAVSLEHAASFGVPQDVLESIAADLCAREVARRSCGTRFARRPNAAAPPCSWLFCTARPGTSTRPSTTWTPRSAQRDPSLVHLAVAPQWDSLRGDPRFAERLAVMGLASSSSSSG